ncbi:DNA-binding response regulator, LytR/AlgR family [Flexibacter flexilis DSM 6793]|uniref:DNA-binding response regulator, LytR/AlgR family n=1 Tax=Flexibacter flexilis DSM 6793 TaxID=927664 RepID=A0A1I1GX57_9BACT|nr:response regulator [Flexibacter flexilis]SFC13753.1 DNA-binding response regulator, LytR/AlgR family [Flexibacter flexilis DSM 6793]
MRKNIRILIVEDEFVTLDLLRDYLEESGYEISGDAMSAAEALEVLEQGQTDFAMLDINIKGDKDGIWLAEQIQEKYHIPFVFLTAFSDAPTVKAASRTHPYGYLVKPFTKADIFTTLEIALSNYNNQKQDKTLNNDAPDTIFVKENQTYTKVCIKEIRYVQAYKNYLELRLADNRQVIRSTLSDFQKALPMSHFIQTHRSYLVNTNFIDKVGSDFLTIGSDEIPLSRGFREEVLKRLNFYI